MVRRFILQCIALGAPIAIALAAYLIWQKAYIPAPRLTSNVALNEQIHRMAAIPGEEVEVLALGSSMALNNLASSPVKQALGTDRYQNAGAWGMGMLETAALAPILVERFQPNTVIVVTNMMDMQGNSQLKADELAAIRAHWERNGSWTDHLRHWDASWVLRQMDLNRIRYHDRGNYEFLGFDPHGSATLDVPKERILASRYDAPPPWLADLAEQRFQALNELGKYLHEQEQTRFVVICSPYREGLRTPAVDQAFEAYVERIRSILLPLGHKVVNGNAVRWADELFCDNSHFNEEGAEAFTRWAMEQLAADTVSSHPAGH